MVSFSSRSLLGKILEVKFPASCLLCVFLGQVVGPPWRRDQVVQQVCNFPHGALPGQHFTVRQDVANAAVAVLLPPEELVVLLDYVVSLSVRGWGPLCCIMGIS